MVRRERRERRRGWEGELRWFWVWRAMDRRSLVWGGRGGPSSSDWAGGGGRSLVGVRGGDDGGDGGEGGFLSSRRRLAMLAISMGL